MGKKFRYVMMARHKPKTLGIAVEAGFNPETTAPFLQPFELLQRE
jgi:hypothetical protein